MVKKSKEQSNEQNLLPEFEATLKSAEFLDLDKEKINKLTDESLRRVTEFISLKQLWLTNDEHDANYIYDNITTKKWLNKFFSVVKWCGSTSSGRAWLGTRYYINYENFLSKNIVNLFDLQNIALTGKDILLISDEKNSNSKPVVFITKADAFLKDGVAALQWYTGDLDKLPRNAIRWKNSIPIKLGDYTLQHMAGETLSISKSWCIGNSIDGHSFDILPKQWKVIEKDVIVNFKSDYLEFFALKQVNENGSNQIRAEKYLHRGVDYIDYEKYGTCVQWILDPNKNFIIGIFELGSNRSLKILRVDVTAELMESFDNIDEFVGFDNDMDIIVYDHDGKLRKIDANFNNFPLYTETEIVGLHTNTDYELTEVIGDCKTYPDMFGTTEYVKAVAIVLWQNNMISKEVVKELLTKISTNEYITYDERDNLLFLLQLDNPSLLKTGNIFIDKLKIQKPLWSKREAPLNKLLFKEDSEDANAEKVVTEFSAYLKKYPHVADVDKIIKHGPFTHLIKDDRHALQIKKWDHYETIIDDVSWLMIELSTNNYIITYTKENMQGTLTLNNEGTIINKVISSDIYVNTPSFNEQWIGIAQHKDTKKRWFVQLKNNSIDGLGAMEYNSLSVYSDPFYQGIQDKKKVLLIPLLNQWAVYTKEFQKIIDNWNIYTINNFNFLLINDAESKEWIISTDRKNIIEIPIEGKFIDGEKQPFSKTGCLVRDIITSTNNDDKKDTPPKKVGKIVYQVTWDGSVMGTDIIKEILVLEKGNYCIGVDTENKLVWYVLTDKWRENKVQDITYLWSSKISGGQLAANKECYFGYNAKNELVGYIHMAWGEKLLSFSPQELAEWLGITPWTVIGSYLLKGREYFFVKWIKDEILLVPYTELSEPHIYQSIAYYRFKNEEWKYGIWRVMNNKREEFLVPTSISEPNFQNESFSFWNDTYNINNKGEFIKLEHDFDTLKGLDQVGRYTVSKWNKHWFAQIVNGQIQLKGELLYDGQPKVQWNRCVVKEWENYQLQDIQWWRDKKKIYNVQYEPLFDLIDEKYLMFYINEHWYIIEPLDAVCSGNHITIPQYYNKIDSMSIDKKKIYKLQKKEWWYNFLVDGRMHRTTDEAKDIISLETFQATHSKEQYLIIGNDEFGKKWIYFSYKWIIDKISSKNYTYRKEVYTDKIIENKNFNYKERVYKLFDDFYDPNSFEYIIIKDHIDSDIISFYTIPKDENLTQEDFIINGEWRLDIKQSSLLKLFIKKENLDSKLKLIKEFGVI